MENNTVGSPFWSGDNLFEEAVAWNYTLNYLKGDDILKAVMEIFFAFFMLVGGAKVSQGILVEVRREILMKVHRGLPSLESFTRKLTQQNPITN